MKKEAKGRDAGGDFLLHYTQRRCSNRSRGPFPGGLKCPVAKRAGGPEWRRLPTEETEQGKLTIPQPTPQPPRDARAESRRGLHQRCTMTTPLRRFQGTVSSLLPLLTHLAPRPSQTPNLTGVSASLPAPPPRPRKIRLPAPRPAARASQTAASAAPFRLFRSGSRPRPASRLPAP